MPNPHFEIIIPIVAVATVAFIVIIVIVWRGRFGKKDDVLPQLGLDGVMPSETRRRRSGTLTPHAQADIERAQKFRERARTVAMGKPKFKTRIKGRSGSFKHLELNYNNLENHQFGDKVITFRRISEDRTSAYSVTDIENNSGAVVDEDLSFSSYDYRRIIGQVKEDEEQKS